MNSTDATPPQETTDAGTGSRSCIGCASELPLRPLGADEKGYQWECAGCGAKVMGVLIDGGDADAKSRVRLAGFHIDEMLLPEPPRGVQIMASQHEQRDSERRALAISVTALKLDGNLHPVGEPFRIMTRDISESGIGLLHYEPVDAPYLAIQLPGLAEQPIQLVTELVRCREVDGYYDVAGMFVTRSDF